MAYALMAVPVHLVEQVGQLIANDAGSGSPASETATTETENQGILNGWTDEPLRDHFQNSSEKMQKFLVFLAEHTDQEVSSEDAAAAIGFPTWNSIAGMLGAAGRRAGNHYGLSEAPWHQPWDHNEGRYRFEMPSEIAAIVLNEAGK